MLCVCIGLRDGHLPAPEVVGPPPLAPGHQEPTGPGRPKPGQGHLEARGLLPQRQGGQLPVRHCAQCAHQDPPRRGDPLYFEVCMVARSTQEKHLFALCLSLSFLADKGMISSFFSVFLTLGPFTLVHFKFFHFVSPPSFETGGEKNGEMSAIQTLLPPFHGNLGVPRAVDWKKGAPRNVWITFRAENKLATKLGLLWVVSTHYSYSTHKYGTFMASHMIRPHRVHIALSALRKTLLRTATEMKRKALRKKLFPRMVRISTPSCVCVHACGL